MAKPWWKNGKPLFINGAPVYCDACPCDPPPPPVACLCGWTSYEDDFVVGGNAHYGVRFTFTISGFNTAAWGTNCEPPWDGTPGWTPTRTGTCDKGNGTFIIETDGGHCGEALTVYHKNGKGGTFCGTNSADTLSVYGSWQEYGGGTLGIPLSIDREGYVFCMIDWVTGFTPGSIALQRKVYRSNEQAPVVPALFDVRCWNSRVLSSVSGSMTKVHEVGSTQWCDDPTVSYLFEFIDLRP
ncbi:MAG TPA: hypothetical protein VGN57_12725 [Pirellulaceae bacterium]|jgi:hypothetical protein|nr:hypothetical protein [Pirellulaceae bacterium]